MKKILNTLPTDWVYQLVTLSLITTFTYYLFENVKDYQMIKEFWSENERFYIYTFLFMQFVVKAVFYWGLFLLIKRYVFEKIKRKYYDNLRRPKTISELKDLNELKKILIDILGVPVQYGLIKQGTLVEKIELDEHELVQTMKNNVKWICVSIHAVIVAVMVWNLNSYVIIPLLLVFLLLAVGYWYISSFVYANAELIDKVRVGLLK